MARPQTALNAHGGMQKKLSEQNETALIYGKIRDGQWPEAIRLLQIELQEYPKSRACLSLLGYCYYFIQDFGAAANTYEELVKHHQGIDEYRVYYAQSLYKAGMYDQALRICNLVTDPQFSRKILLLTVAIKYEQDDVVGCRAFIDEYLPKSDPDAAFADACLSFKGEQFEDAITRLADAKNHLGYAPDLSYNTALCHYKLGQYGPALKHVADIIEKGIHEHPELSVGSGGDGVEVRSIGNSQVLRESMLVEAFNLKSAIEYQLNNMEAAQDAIADMPPRSEDELDAVTLHNQGLVNMAVDPSEGVRKLNFLLGIASTGLDSWPEFVDRAGLGQATFPPETFGNLLLLYCKLGYFDLAGDLLAANLHLRETHLSQDLYEYLEAMILVHSSPEEAFRKFDLLSSKHIDQLRKLTKNIQDGRVAHDNNMIKASLKEYDTALEQYIPVLMSQARIYWDRQNYAAIEAIFKQSAEFCSDHDVWRLNVAHTFFMQENKFKEAIRYYEPIVKKQAEHSILDVTAMVLANLCVSYIMTSQNDVAQELMNQIEKEEELMEFDSEGKPAQLYHLCIVNLVIGTLYCAKLNFKFGISRIMKSLEPFNKKLNPDTWYYTKRCLLALADNLAKHMMMFGDEFFYELVAFLDGVEDAGANIRTTVNVSAIADRDRESRTVASEARMFKRFFLKLRE